MQIINRFAERMGDKERRVVHDDHLGASEVLLCPLSGDVEVWFKGECLYKACSHDGYGVLYTAEYRRARKIAKAAERSKKNARVSDAQVVR